MPEYTLFTIINHSYILNHFCVLLNIDFEPVGSLFILQSLIALTLTIILESLSKFFFKTVGLSSVSYGFMYSLLRVNPYGFEVNFVGDTKMISKVRYV